MVNEFATSIKESEESSKDQSLLSTSLNYLQWNSHSSDLLNEAEDKLFSKIKTPFNRYYVKLGPCIGDDDYVWTFSANENNKNVPIVLVHGFGAGIGFWSLNVEELSQDRPVYAFDILGCSKSSRPLFSSEPKEIEDQFVDSIEKWRESLGIEKMILLGHSFGGFLTSCYAVKYPERLEHLILVDAWGHDETPDFQDFPLWKKSVAYSVRLMYGPFSMMRSFGPFGERLIKTLRPDLLEKFTEIVDESIISQYIYHCNNQMNPTGESAFHKMTQVGPWPIYPVGERMKEKLCEKIPVSFFYGELTWMSKKFGPSLKAHRGDNSYTFVKIFEDSGHHIYLDKAGEFNESVREACKILKSQQ